MSTANVESQLPAPNGPPAEPKETERRTFSQRIEAFVSRLSTRNNFWHKVCSLIWLPFAFRSGITMKRLDANRFSAVLPFRRANRNWYNAMAGAALLGNSEVAGGMFLFAECGSDYIVVCKELNYQFLRPCVGPAIYHIQMTEDLRSKIDSGKEFNVSLDIEIRQSLKLKNREREIRVGKCQTTFHCTPKAEFRRRYEIRKNR
ncbi:MAG: DUF4442 domain-containing protein [Planctomycetota bacterium]